MIIFDKVYIKGFDNYEYVLNFRINPKTLNAIVTPSLFDKRTLVKLITGSSTPMRGRVYVGENIRKIGVYDPEWKPPPLMRIHEYVAVTTGSDDLFYYLAEQLGKLGVKVDEYSVFENLPQPIVNLITLYTTLSVPRDLYILIDPFEYLDETLLNFTMSILRENVRKGGTVVVITSNRTCAKTFRFDQYVEVSKHELSLKTVPQRNIEIPEDCLIYEAMLGEKTSENFFKSIMELKGFRGVLLIRNKAYILVEPKYGRRMVKILKEALDKGVFRKIKSLK